MYEYAIYLLIISASSLATDDTYNSYVIKVSKNGRNFISDTLNNFSPNVHLIDNETFVVEENESSIGLLVELRHNPFVKSIQKEKHLERELFDEDSIFTDPEYISGKQDWYLNKIRVPQAWAKCLSGKGVIVAVVDRGVNRYHPDLAENYDDSLALDVQRNLDQADPVSRDEVHGTKSAGVIAAQKNNFCGVGIAYEATITGIRLFGKKSLTDSMEARALSHNLDKIDIYSNSWGPPNNGEDISPFGDLSIKAVQYGVTYGRKGKGAIYVFAAGNGGVYQDSCAYDGYVNDIRTIAVTAVHESGRILRSSERCSAIFVSAFSRNKLDENNIITTTDGNECTGNYGRTSAAAPQVSAVIALALQANPLLGWRDVQHLIVRTSNHNRRLRYWSEDTLVNGAGYRVSSAFGFGLIDAEKMVDLASKWENVSPMKKCVVSVIENGEKEIPGDFKKYIKCDSIRYLEHVEVSIDATYCVRGYTKVSVISPSRTTSVVMPGRYEDYRTTLLKWTADTVQFWGENPIGEWTVAIEPIENGKFKCRGSGVLRALSITLYGTYDRPGKLKESSLNGYCPVKKGGYLRSEADKFLNLQSSYYELRYQYDKLLKDSKTDATTTEKNIVNLTTETVISYSSFSSAPIKRCQDRFFVTIRGKLLQSGRDQSSIKFGVTNLKTCKLVCFEEPECRSITFISKMYQKSRSGKWNYLGERCYVNKITAVASVLKEPPPIIDGSFVILNRLCD